MADRQVFRPSVEVPVNVTVKDPDVFERITGPAGREWRQEHQFNLHTREDVLKHLAYECAVHGIGRANRLDGWDDLPDEAARMEVAVDR